MIMEPQKKRFNLKPTMSEKRSPLQNLSALHFHKSNTKITSNLSSAVTPASLEARNGCLRFTNSSSDTSSSSRTRLERKPKSLPKVATNSSVKSFRSKENEMPRKPFSEMLKKKQHFCADERENGRSKTNPMSKTAQISKLSFGRGNSVKKGSEALEGKKLKGRPPFESSTPAGSSSGVRRNAAKGSDSRTADGGSGSATSAKTPPVEVSVSPEIQSKMMVSKSAATPVCYGAGHLLSGVTDKRKCRRRGSLRGGFEKINLFDDEQNDKNMGDDLQESLVPLPAEASVRWLLSPCSEGSDSENKLEECEMSCGNASLALGSLSSPSTLCGNVCELGCDNSDFKGSGSVDDVANLRKAGIFVLSPHENCQVQCVLENSDKKMCDLYLAATPSSISNFNSVSLGEGKNASGNSSAVSLGSLSSGNIIQTPNSDCSSYECTRRLNVEEYQRSFVQFEIDSITETLDAVSLSSRCESIPYAGLGPSSHSIAPIRHEKNVESVCSWESSSTFENLTLSRMRISWRDGPECRIDEQDDFDCCPCLSDEEIDAVGCSDQQLKLYQLSQSVGDKENKHEGKDLRTDNDVSPIILEYEPYICAAPKEKSSRDRLHEFAESMCTNGGDLAVSSDSDWANIQQSHSFQVK